MKNPAACRRAASIVAKESKMPRSLARNALLARNASLLAAAVLCLAQPSAQAAEDDTIVTDRPDFVESSKVVGKGRFQLETSFLLERDKNDVSRDRTLSTPTLLRFGVGDAFEFRVETDGRAVARSTDLFTGERTTVAGYADTALGVKWHLLDENGIEPSLAMLVHADLPSGSPALRGQGVRPSLRFAAEWELPADLSLGVMPGIGVEHNDSGTHYNYGIFGVVLGKSFSDRLRGFVEIATPQVARGVNGGTQASFDIGAAYLLSDTCQIDTMLSRGLNRRTPDLSWTVGLSIKL
jgi:hypothetical protein